MSAFARPYPISDKDFISALQIRCSRVFPAMSIANALGGYESDDWWLIRNHSLADLLAEADRRGINLLDVKSCMPGEDLDPPLLVNCPRYQQGRTIGGAK